MMGIIHVLRNHICRHFRPPGPQKWITFWPSPFYLLSVLKITKNDHLFIVIRYTQTAKQSNKYYVFKFIYSNFWTPEKLIEFFSELACIYKVAFLDQPGSVYAWSFCESKVVFNGSKMVFDQSNFFWTNKTFRTWVKKLNYVVKFHFLIQSKKFWFSPKSFGSVQKVLVQFKGIGPIQNTFGPTEETRH